MSVSVMVMSIVPMFSSFVKERFQKGDPLCIFLREARYLK
jgi:hypothetical protein